MIAPNSVCLWYEDQALEAARFYAATFADSRVLDIQHAPDDYPGGHAGQVLTVRFQVLGIPCLGLNGGPAFVHNEAFSFQVATDDQAQTDRLWHALVDNGGQPGACGWCKDRWGISWQITPRLLIQALSDPDPALARRAFHAMMAMGRIDIATVAKAIAG